MSEIKYLRITLAVNTILLIFFPLITYLDSFTQYIYLYTIFIFGLYGLIKYSVKIKEVELNKLIFKKFKN